MDDVGVLANAMYVESLDEPKNQELSALPRQKFTNFESWQIKCHKYTTVSQFLQYSINIYQNHFGSFQKQYLYSTLLNIFYHFTKNFSRVPNTTGVALYSFLPTVTFRISLRPPNSRFISNLPCQTLKMKDFLKIAIKSQDTTIIISGCIFYLQNCVSLTHNTYC